MRLSCQKAFVLMIAATLGCNDTFAPKLPASFSLVNINGRSLPTTYFSPTPGPTETVLFAQLTLDSDGKAFWVEQRRQFDGTLTEISNTFDYKITFNQIEIGSFSPCPINANCMGTYKGTISNEAVTLNLQATTDGAVIYNFRTNLGLTPY